MLAMSTIHPPTSACGECCRRSCPRLCLGSLPAAPWGMMPLSTTTLTVSCTRVTQRPTGKCSVSIRCIVNVDATRQTPPGRQADPADWLRQYSCYLSQRGRSVFFSGFCRMSREVHARGKTTLST